MYDFNGREDLQQAGGFKITLATDARGVHVRYLLLLRRLPIWRMTLKPKALICRCYEDGEITLEETIWEG